MSAIDLHDAVASRPASPAVFAGLRRLWTSFRRARATHRTAIALSQLDPHLLRDIGVEPQDVIAAIHGRDAPSILFNPMRRG